MTEYVELFTKQFDFKGKHAKMARELSEKINDKGFRIFETSLALYVVAPMIGFLNKRRSPVDHSSSDERSIFKDIIGDNRIDLLFNFQTIMLLDTEYEPDETKRITKAFAGQNTVEDLDRYHDYVRGGVEILHNLIMKNKTTEDDYAQGLFDMVDDCSIKLTEIDMDTFRANCQKYN